MHHSTSGLIICPPLDDQVGLSACSTHLFMQKSHLTGLEGHDNAHAPEFRVSLLCKNLGSRVKKFQASVLMMSRLKSSHYFHNHLLSHETKWHKMWYLSGCDISLINVYSVTFSSNGGVSIVDVEM